MIPSMKLARVQDIEHAGDGKVLARPLLDGTQCNVRVIRLAVGGTLPPHRHGESELMLFVADGEGELDTPSGAVPFERGALAFYQGEEELRVRNSGTAEMTLLAFLAPKFAAG
jgi:quercetin dioxygenase-like cupin family protein